jgi:hypothetical protein
LPFHLCDQSLNRDAEMRQVLFDDVPGRREICALLFVPKQIA